jgi:hypothetical protein
LGKYHTKYKNLKWVIEFKHFSRKKAKETEVYTLSKARDKEIRQVNGYANDIIKNFPEYNIEKFIIYTISYETYSFSKID